MGSVAMPQNFCFKFIQSNFKTLISLHQQISNLLRSYCPVSIGAGTLFALTAPPAGILLLLYTKKKNKIDRDFVDFEDQSIVPGPADAFSPGDEIVTPGDAEYTEHFIASDAEYAEHLIASDAEYAEHLIASDAEYAKEIQLQESLLASFFTSTIANTASTSLHQPIENTASTSLHQPITNTASTSLQQPITNTASTSLHQPITDNSPQLFCEICMEDKQRSEMFNNNNCSHSFCHDCTTGHIMAKIQDNVNPITCPALNCKSTINIDDCREMIPNDALVKWDEILCLALIPESHKLYCPFRECSSMLVNDSGEILREIKCPSCKRLFCAECRVPWHSGFTCKEFQKKKDGKDDEILKSLANKEKWQKCPKCKMYVEKTEGCVRITCRCRYEFCYICGSKWSNYSHDNCWDPLGPRVEPR